MTPLSPILESELAADPRYVGTTRASQPPADGLDLSDLLRHVPPYQLEKGAWLDGFHMAFIVSGLVHLVHGKPDQTQIGFGIYGSGAYVLLAGDAITALTKGTLVQAWTGADFELAVSKQPALAPSVLSDFYRCELAAMRRRALMHAGYSKQRMIRVLLELAERLGAPTDLGGLTMPPITHEALARELSTSREMATLELNQLKRARAIYYSRAAFTVYPERLREALKEHA